MLALIAFAFGVSAHAGQALLPVRGTKVSLIPPPGFTAAKLFPGFQHEDSGSSIMVTEMPAPLSEIMKGMTVDGLATKGMTLLKSEDAKIAGRSAKLLSVSQAAHGLTFHKWLGLFGTESATVLVVATFPEATSKTIGEPLRKAVLSSQWDPGKAVDRYEGLDFRITETTDLKIAKRIGNMLLITKDGASTRGEAKDPMVVVGSSVSKTTIADLETFSTARVKQTAGTKDLKVAAGKSVTIGGLSGYELSATAKDQKSGTPIVVYQVILAKAKHYYILQGMVAQTNAKRYVPQFSSIAKSFRLADQAKPGGTTK